MVLCEDIILTKKDCIPQLVCRGETASFMPAELQTQRKLTYRDGQLTSFA